MSAELFLGKLEETGLLDESVLNKLRGKLAKPGKQPSADSMAQYLIAKGHLTQSQADRLLQAVEATPAAPLQPADLMDGLVEESPVAQEVVELTPAANPNPVVLDPLNPLNSPQQPLPNDPFANPLGMPAPGLGYDPLGGHAEVGAYAEPEEIEPEGGAGFQGKQTVTNQWDSKWIFIMPTTLVFLVLLSFALYFLLAKGDSKAQFQEAEDAFENANYMHAQELYDEYAEKFKSEPSTKTAEVMSMLCRLRIPHDNKRWDDAIVAMDQYSTPLVEMLSEIADDPTRVDEIRAQIGGISVGIPEGFVSKAENTIKVDEQKEWLDKARDAMRHVDNGITMPRQVRDTPSMVDRMKTLRERISKVARLIQQEESLVDGIGQMDTLTKSDDTVAAFEIYVRLVREFPALQSDSRLLQQVRAASEKERELVVPAPIRIAEAEPAKIDGSKYVLVNRVGEEISELEGEIAAFLIRGAVYAVDISKGKVLWRYHVGFQTQIEPQVWKEESEHRFIISDESRKQVSAIDAVTGKVYWTLDIGDYFNTPAVVADQMFVSTASGKIYQIEIGSGQCNRATQIPQALSLAPGVRSRSSQTAVYQVGQFMNLYVLDRRLQCTDVFYIGHQEGAICVPPLVVSNHVVVAENKQNDRCELRILKRNEEGTMIAAQNPILIDGHVTVNLQRYGRRFMAITEKGFIGLFDVDPVAKDRPVKEVARATQSLNSSQIKTQFAINSGKLWIGDIGLSRYDLQLQNQKLASSGVSFNIDQFLGPFQVYDTDSGELNGIYSVNVRQRGGSTLMSIGCVRGGEQDDTWRIDFAAPLTGPVFDDGYNETLRSVNAQGDVFEVKGDKPVNIIDQPVARATNTAQDLVFVHQVKVGDRFVMVGPPDKDKILTYQPSNEAIPLRMLPLDMSGQTLSGAPVEFGDRVLIMTSSGEIHLVKPGVKGSNVLAPDTKPNQVVDYRRPAVIDKNRFAISTSNGQVTLVEVLRNGKMDTLGRRKYEGEFTNSLASIQGVIIAAAVSGREHKLLTFTVPAVKQNNEKLLDGAVVFGPEKITDDKVICSTDLGKMYCFDKDLNEKWAIELPGSPIAGFGSDGNRTAIVLVDGKVMWIDNESGKVSSEKEIGESFLVGQADPTVIDGKLYLSGADGTIHVVNAE